MHVGKNCRTSGGSSSVDDDRVALDMAGVGVKRSVVAGALIITTSAGSPIGPNPAPCGPGVGTVMTGEPVALKAEAFAYVE